MQITKIPIDLIIPYEHNVKEHPQEQIDKIKRSIAEFGNNDPIAVDEKNVIIEGHGRLMALQQLGYTEAECIVISGLTEEQKRAYRLVHNKLTMTSGFDLVGLEEEINRIKSIDMSSYSFDADQIAKEASAFIDSERAVVQDEVPDVAETTESKVGDIWRLGDHRLICGDATSEDHYSALMQDEDADMIMTDPPYNVDYSGKAKSLVHNDGKIINDQFDDEDSYRDFLEDTFRIQADRLKDGGAVYCWHASTHATSVTDALESVGITVRQQLIWVKDRLVIGRQDYQWRHETCMYGWKDGAAHYFTADRTHQTVIDDRPDVDDLSKDELRELCRKLLEPDPQSSVLEYARPNASLLHPTTKPVIMIADLISNSSLRGWTVLDPFGGSGSTLIACEQTGRRCRMIELDPYYCDVIVKRWEALTGKKAIKETA